VDGDSGEWQRGLTALWQYVAFRGTAAVPPRAVAVGVAIGAWAEARRQNYWAGDLHPSCVAALESLPGWSWAGRSERRWSTRYAGAMPPDNAVAGRLHIGEWATAQRRAHAAGNLPKPLTEQLDALPGWQWTEDRWQRGLTALRAYLAQHETLEDVDGAEIHGFALGHWVKRCRDDYRSGSLNGWQIDDLESLPGWTWRGPDERWRQGIAALRAYYLRHGGAQPPRRAVVNGFAIGAWVQGCRRDYRQGTLSAEHVAELESIPTWAWSVRRRPGKD
jgi:Helicase associated domain